MKNSQNGSAAAPEVVIAGGGIGGLSNALALARSGRSVRLLERAPEFGEVGAGLQLGPNSTRILREWGLLDAVLERAVVPRLIEFRDVDDARLLTSIDLGPAFVSRYGAPYVVMHRQDLHEILLDACRVHGVELINGAEVSDVVIRQTSATAVTSQGEHTGQVLLAADGLWSSLRRLLHDDEPICSGYIAYRGARPIDDRSEGLSGEMSNVVIYVGPGRHFVRYPVRGGHLLNQVAVFRSKAFDRGEQDWGGLDELQEMFGTSAPEVVAGLPALMQDRSWPMFDRLPCDRWVDRRLALTGDAAHPMLQYLAQGAGQAIEDAHGLAASLSDCTASGANVDWDAVLAGYEKARVARAGEVQTVARGWGDLWHCDGLARSLRDELFRLHNPSGYRYTDWLYGHGEDPSRPLVGSRWSFGVDIRATEPVGTNAGGTMDAPDTREKVNG